MALNSNDISKFDFDVLWDLSLTPPRVTITNMSEGNNLAGCTFWFEITSGGGLVFHLGLEATPDKTGVWSDFLVPESMPEILGHIDWSGTEFKVVGYVKDSADNIFSTTKTDRLCRPNGNEGNTANNFGKGSLYVETKCEKARLWVEDKTNYSYSGNAGTMVSKTIKLIYPEDSTGTTPPPKTLTNVNNGLIPIWYSAQGYRIILTAIYQYVLSNGDSVMIKYKYDKFFPVQCNVDLCPLICDVQRMEDAYKRNGCSGEEREKMILINSMLTRAMMAKMQPMCGVDLPALVEEIKKLGGFTCNCTGDEFNGINEISGAGGLDCDGVQECINTLLNQINPNCLSGDWTTITLLEKFRLMISGACCTPISLCAPPTELEVTANVAGSGEVTIAWTASTDPVLQYEWVMYKVSDGTIVNNGTTALTQVTVNGLADDTEYRFEIRSKCGATAFSNFVTLLLTTPEAP